MKTRMVVFIGIAVWLLSHVCLAEWRDVYDRGGQSVYSGTAINASAGSVSSAILTSGTLYQSIQYTFGGPGSGYLAPTAANLRVLCSNDGTNYFFPNTSGTNFTLTTTSGIQSLALPPCRLIKFHLLNNDGSLTITPTMTFFGQ